MESFILQGDITTFAVDTIVNAANTSLLGRGGADEVVHRAAGPELLEECRRLHGCEASHAKIMLDYRLPTNYAIHTPGLVWHGGGAREESLLAFCYQGRLRLAGESGCHTVAFPSISTGVYRFPLECAAYIAVREIPTFS